ncbi:endonuclease/exonuclease/phosphatase family protein [Demequina lutea]|uniref:Endonuclease/exonuclease/phosphatase (EEP) superfamily protein YafD n=1 Tax=Demequina lutea TaxID=431489 RepID=A0A7Y9Z9P9_9MICO|nr:endonuclease/exonuclease/phosphatase family protein [Demequina lutea]NYI40593.1 endonuclease/exonuclease/phosphatase (EEP) superfamily protein YafD [Demequina lutea]
MGDTASQQVHDGTAGAAHVASRRRRWPVFVRAAAALSLAAVLVPIVVRLTGWEAGPLAYAVSFMPWVTVACILPLVCALLARSWTLTAVAGVALILCDVWLAPLSLANGPTASLAKAATLRVATLNLTLGQADAHAVVAMVRDRSIDVLAVEELTPAEADALRAAGLESELPYGETLPQSGVEGTGLWSRLPMASAEPVPGLTSHAARATVTVGGEPVAIFAVHPAAPGLFDHSRWASDMEALSGILSKPDGPVIVAGDFNTTRDHRAFRDLEALGFRDAVDQAGAGFLPTFPNGTLPMPVVAIDHVMVHNSQLSAVSVTTVVVPSADHRALVVTYVWQK